MTEKSPMKFYPQGAISIYGENAVNPGDSQETTEERIERINTKENLINIINGENGASELIRTVDYPDGTRMSIVHPSGPYTDRALMIGVYNENIQTDEITQWIYDYPENIQRDYWHTVVVGIGADDEILRQEGKSHVDVIWAENTMRVSLSERTSRTVKFPHGQFLEIDSDRIHPTTSVLHHLEEEQDVLKRSFLVSRFGKRLIDKMESVERASDTFQVRRNEPYGYQFNFPNEMDLEGVESVKRFMRVHHQAYTDTTKYYLDHARNNIFQSRENSVFSKKLESVKKQPAYRTYFCLNRENESIDVVISPMFWSHGGVMEALGIRLDRNPEHQKIVSDAEKKSHGKKFNDFVEREWE